MRKAVVLLAVAMAVTVGCRNTPRRPLDTPLHRYGISVYENAVVINTIVDGLDKRAFLFGEPTSIVTFELRDDGWQHTSVRLVRKRNVGDSYDSAVVLVPTAEDLAKWKAWFAEAIAEAKKKAGQTPDREYPGRVLPPK